MEERRGVYRVLVGKCKGKREPGRNSHRCEDNIKICLQGKNGWRHVTRMEERRGEVCTAFWWGNVRDREHLEGVAVECRIILKCFFQIRKGWAYYIDKWPVTFGFQKILEISCVTE